MTWRKLAVVGLLLLGACAPSGESAAPAATSPTTATAPESAGVPPAFRHACGKPGSKVRVKKVPVTVRHSACDLTGVTITMRGRMGAVVPDPGIGVGNSSGLSVTRSDNGDVTVDAQGSPGDL